jgi:hypothetical protein
MRALLLIGELCLVGLAALSVRRFAPERLRSRFMFAVKAYLTLRVMGLILLHEVDGVTVYTVLAERMADLDPWSFVWFTLVAMVLKLLGIGASITRWILMLRGQGIELPSRHIVGAFFIGRFLGTFLPSTLGLDGYKLYDAARFSGRTVEVSTATLVEKLLGGSGIFGTFLIALPFGVAIFGDTAPLIALVGIPIAFFPLAVIALAFFWPGPILIRWTVDRIPLPTLGRTLDRIAEGATAYGRRKGLLLTAWALSLVQHFTTAAMYYFTARALGVRPESRARAGIAAPEPDDVRCGRRIGSPRLPGRRGADLARCDPVGPAGRVVPARLLSCRRRAGRLRGSPRCGRRPRCPRGGRGGRRAS